MSNNNRKGNRTSVPTRGGLRRSNTPPPPLVRLGIDGLPETEPISTSRPRGNEGPNGIPVLQPPPADVVAAAQPEVILPPKPAAPAAPPAPAVAKTAPVATKAAPEDDINSRTTLVSPPEALAAGPVAALESEEEGEGDSRSQSAPPVSARGGAAPAARRRGRGNLKPSTGKSMPPPKANLAEEVTARVAASHAAESAKATPLAPPVATTEPAHRVAEDAPAASAPPSDIADRFFDHGERAAAEAQAHRDDGDLEGYDDKLAHKNSPEARARRQKNWNYVLIAGGLSVLLLLFAVVKNRLARGEAAANPVEPPVEIIVVPSAVSPPKAETPPVAPGAPSAAAPAVASAAPSAAASAANDIPAPAASGEAAGNVGPTAAASAPLPAAAEPTADDKKTAAQEKRACQSLLDQGAFAKAVEAGEHSVSLDPTDGEAWLMLGAAYQSMGKPAEARRSFSACVAEGKRGPIGECRSMLR